MSADLRGMALAGIVCIGLAGCGAPHTERAADGAPPGTDGGRHTGADAQTAVDASDAGTLRVDAPNAQNLFGASAPVHGTMTQVAIDQWRMPDGTDVTFFPDAGGTFRYFVTRRGAAIR